MPDHEVCSCYPGITPSLVGRRRRQLAIRAYSPPRNVSAPWTSLPGWTGTAEDLTAAVECLGDEDFAALYTRITGVAPKKRTAKTTNAVVKSILRRWSAS